VGDEKEEINELQWYRKWIKKMNVREQERKNGKMAI
jgi:hypothetical protein